MNIKKIVAVICSIALLGLLVFIVPDAGLTDDAARGTIDQRKVAAAEYVAEGKFVKAINTYKSILEENPSDEETRKTLIDVYLKINDYSGAAEETKNIVMSQPASKENYDVLIDLYQKSAESYKALEFIEEIEDTELRREYLDAAYDRTSENALVVGNTMGNLSSGGVLAFKDDAIFYCDPARGYSLYKKENGAEQLLCNGRISALNIIGDYLYFVDQSRDYAVFKIKTDGTDFSKVGKDIMATNLTIIGDRMYFINWMDDCKVYYMNMDGTGLTKISNRPTEMLYSYGTNLYLSDRDDIESFYRVSLDGEGEQFVLDSSVYFVTGYDNNVYFRAQTEDGLRIYRMTTDGTVYEEINASRCGYINADKGEVFIVDFENGGAVIRMDENGQNQKILSSDGANHLSIDGDWLYYFSDHNDKKLYRIRKDGTGRECLN